MDEQAVKLPGEADTYITWQREGGPAPETGVVREVTCDRGTSVRAPCSQAPYRRDKDRPLPPSNFAAFF